MLEFQIHQVQLGPRFYLLLPKLNKAQVGTIAERLAEKGFVVQRTSSLAARMNGTSIHVSPAGFCWSTKDPSDAIVPTIPAILETTKEKMELLELRDHYFKLQRSGKSAVLRLSSRLESSPVWRTLRASDQCMLTPDEQAVALLLMRSSSARCNLLTDFPTRSGRVRMIGKRQYYESRIDTVTAEATLRAVGQRGSRNSYIPERGILQFEAFRLPMRESFAELFRGLGEWCYLRPP